MFDSKNIKPMLLGEISKPFNNSNFLYELKYDGYRVIIYVSKDKLEIRSRKARSHLKDKNKIAKLAEEYPVVFVAFDILYQDRELINKKLIERKEILNKYTDTNFFVKSKIFNDGIKLFNKIKKLDLEGIVAKEKDSFYVPNKRVNFWIKIKNFKKGEFIVHGIVFNKEKYSLLIGEYRNKKLYYVGKVSVTSKNKILKDLLKIKQSKNIFVNCQEEAKYILPTEKILVHFMEKTLNGSLREPFIAK